MYQLIDDNISIFNIFSRKEVTIQTLEDDLEITPSQYMLSRIIEGDKSDNILGIEGIGPKRAQTLAKEYETLDNLLEALPIKGRSKYIQNLNAGRDQLIRNEKLINLKQYCVEAICAGKEGEWGWGVGGERGRLVIFVTFSSQSTPDNNNHTEYCQ